MDAEYETTAATPAGDYDRHGHGHATVRRPDPRIAALVHAALGDARTIVDVGAGAGSYEPADRYVLPVEPSAVMRAQRPRHLAPALDATAENLPFDDGALDLYWLAEYAPELIAAERGRYPSNFVEPEAEARGMEKLRRDLESGAWDERYGHLRSQPEFTGSLRLVVGHV